MVKRILNAGAGPLSATRRLASFLSTDGWEEVRFDIEPAVNPDVVGSITNIDQHFSPASFDAILCSHVLEHLYAHEIFPTLQKFRKILNPEGFALVMCPDLEAVAAYVAEKGLNAVAYVSPAGPIRGLDMIYGHARSIEQGRHHMAHRTGFTSDRLGHLLVQAGFADVNVRASEYFELVALAFQEKADREAAQAMIAASGFDMREGAA
jgi:predicted SAM-dependent methyltransferase